MDSFPIPDFVVVGGHVEDYVVLVASNTLSSAELKEELRYPDRLYGARSDECFYPPEYDMWIIAKVKEYVVVRGKDYPEAWRNLFSFWSPEPEPKSIVAQRDSYPAGYPELGG